MKRLYQWLKGDYKNFVVIFTALFTVIQNATVLIMLDRLDASIMLRVLITTNFLVVFIFTWVFTIYSIHKQNDKERLYASDQPYRLAKSTIENLKYTVAYVENMTANYNSVEKKECDKVYFILQLHRIRDSLLLILNTVNTEPKELP